MIITTIGDEIGTTLEDQIEALKEVNRNILKLEKLTIFIYGNTQKNR